MSNSILAKNSLVLLIKKEINKMSHTPKTTTKHSKVNIRDLTFVLLKPKRFFIVSFET